MATGRAIGYVGRLKRPASTRVELCGRLGVEIEGRQLAAALPGRQGRLLFAFLVLHRARPVRRDELVAALWPEKPPASADDALNTLVSRLRKAVGEGVVCGRAELTLALPPGAYVDIESASEQVERAECALERSDWQEARCAAEFALGIAEQGFLAELDVSWVEDERGRIEELRLRALECLAACGLGVGGAQLSATERAGRALIAAAPFRETGYRYLMQALAERGRVAEALKVFDAVRRLLQEELGAPPGAALRSLNERLLNDPGLVAESEREDPLAVGSTMVTLLLIDCGCPADGDSDRGDELRLAALRLLRHAVAAYGTRGLDEVNGRWVAVFKNARNGLGCAIQLQQAVERHNARCTEGRLSIRAALHVSESLRENAVHTAAEVTVAQALCERAAPGQILASAPVRSLASAEQRFGEPAVLDLPGAPNPLVVSEVAWEPAALPRLPLPPAFSARERGVFVGREPDLQRLWGLYDQARSGTRQIVLVRGDAGIGKTRLATELASRAHDEGAVVLYGRCDEEPLVPHQPFVEALRDYVASCPLAELVGQLGHSSGELRRLVPELAARVPDLAPALAGDPDGERYRLFAAVSALLCEAAQDRPVLLVLDDLHWADQASLLLLRHVARNSRTSSLLVLGTYREAELDAGHLLSETVADLSRERGVTQHPLGCLDEVAVARLVISHAGHDAPRLNQAIFQETEGNPFFVVEMLRHLAEAGGIAGDSSHSSSGVGPGEVGIPEGVKAVIGRRIARLGQRAHRVLSIACVAGRDFEYAALVDVSDLDEDQLVEALDQAVRARVIEEVAGAAGRYTFSHALIRDTIYAELTATRRALLHRRVAASLEEAHAGDLEPYRAELAHHFARAGSARDLEKAIEYGARAGDRAAEQLAYEQAAAHYRQAASLIESVQRSGQLKRCDLVIAQGEAERRAGDPAYRATLLEGARLAHQLHDPDRLARAALANNRGFFSTVLDVDRERVSVLEAAIEAQGHGNVLTDSSLRAVLGCELVADGDWPRRAKLSDDAVAISRRVGDPLTLLRTLNYRYVTLWGPRTLHERLANCREADELADVVQEPVLAFHAASFGAHAAMEAGDLALADCRLARASTLAERLGQPVIHWYVAIALAKRTSISGSPREAEKLARAALEAGRNARQNDAFAWFINQLFVIQFLGGTLGSGRPNLLKAAEIGTPFDGREEPTGSPSVLPLVQAAHVLTLCEAGRVDDARVRFEGLMRHGLRDLPHDWTSLAIPTMVSMACAQLGDARGAERLYAMLEPHASQFVDNGVSWLGATTHHLARLAATLGRPDEADGRFAEAADAYATLGAGPWVARVQLDWAQTLVARRSVRDARHAEELLTQALDAAQQLGLAKVERESASLMTQLARTPSA